METISLDEAARDLPGLIARLKPGERVAILDAAGTVVLDAARPAVPEGGDGDDPDLAGLDPESRAWFERWDALVKETSDKWLDDPTKDAVTILREDRDRF